MIASWFTAVLAARTQRPEAQASETQLCAAYALAKLEASSRYYNSRLDLEMFSGESALVRR